VSHVQPMIPRVLGLDEDRQALVQKLATALHEKAHRNELRRSYYDMHNTLKDLGISVPPTMKSVEVVAGWPAKGVDSMSLRTILDGWTATDGSSELVSVANRIAEDNRLASEIPAAHTSALVHSCAFSFVSQGDIASGEPDVIFSTASAERASGIWDPRRRALSSALHVVDADTQGRITEMVLYRPNETTHMRRDGEVWDIRTTPHSFGMPVELVPHKPSLDRPFGRSRITRAVMYLTDSAVRTMLRTEVGAEFYNAPQRYALGVDDGTFEDKDGNPVPAWSVMLGRLLTLSRDEDGNMPQVGQFAQQTMQPNLDQLRSIAQMFSSETNIPVGSLGIVQDNPQSAEAIRTAYEPLGIEIEHWRRTTLAPAWERQMRRAVAMTDASTSVMLAARGLRAHWGEWSTPSELSRAQASLARIQAIPALASSDVELSRLYSPDEVASVKAHLQSANPPLPAA